MPEPRIKSTDIPKLDAGVMAWAKIWPNWAIDGEEHPILIIKKREDGHVGVLPLTRRPELGKFHVTVTRKFYPSAFQPEGPLYSDESVICLADKHGRTTMVWARPDGTALLFPQGRVALRKISKLHKKDWKSLRNAILEEAALMDQKGIGLDHNE